MAVIYYPVWANASVVVCIALWRPGSPEFVTSLLQLEYDSLLTVGAAGIANGMFQAYVTYSFAENSLVYLFFMATFLASMADTLSA